MAKKKKITNNRGYGTTSVPSKKEVIVDKNDITDKSKSDSPKISNTSNTDSTASTVTAATATTSEKVTPKNTLPLENISTENDHINQLVQRFKSLNEFKATTTLNNLSKIDKLSFNLEDLHIEDYSFSLSDQLERQFLQLISQQNERDTLGIL